MDPLWTPKTKGGAALVMGVYIAIWCVYVYLVRDQKYPLLWMALGLIAAYALFQFWLRAAFRRIEQRNRDE